MIYMKEKIAVNKHILNNRLVMPPMATSKTVDGKVNQNILDYYQEQSAGGYIGLIITEHSYVNLQGKAHPKQMSISADGDINGLKQLAQVIHQNNTKVIAQISHAGSATSKKITGMETISASSVVNEAVVRRSRELPKEMTIEQIQQTVKDFAEASRRAKEAGYDGVEIHSAHGYLLNQFYSPLTNKRNDEYGASSMENRLRIHKEIIRAIRAEVGEDFILAVRLGGCDYTEGGSTIADSVEAAILFEGYGVDLLDISGGLNGYAIPGKKEPGYFSEMTEQIKDKISIPVILTGGITNFDTAENLLRTGKADLIGIGRAILKDSLLAKKMMDIRI